MIEEFSNFAAQFNALTGYQPFPWQESLFFLMVQGEIPCSISLPTGTGKTSIMPIWLLALAWQAERLETPSKITVPRRIVWVVNRRVVVDQATREAELLASRLREKEGSDELQSVRTGLKKLSLSTSNDNLIAISTLRGQFADNATWRSDPSLPAVVVGTVDMIGSRLLFSGYSCGYKSSPLHAGFLGQDCLLVHDEAHLEPAFQELIVAIEAEQRRCGEFRRLRIVALTATSRDDSEPFALTKADWEHEELRRRLEAKKGIAFYPVDDEKYIADKVYERALEFKESSQAVLIFLRKLEDVAKVREKLQKEKLDVQTLTGTLRGLERDALATNNAIFARFMPDRNIAPQDGTVYLVCTSAGEVGINISANHLICDLTPFDSMAQRFGRVNRFGEDDARIDIVYYPSLDGEEVKKKNANLQYDQARKRTLELLQKLPKRVDELNNGSPSALGELLRTLPLADREAAFTPPPDVLPATDILFDAWALTSIREKLPGRPPVIDWLHGVSGWEPPETYVAWRMEVEVINSELQEIYRPEDLLEDYPLKPHELLRDTTERVLKHLEAITARCPELSVWLVDFDGTVEVRRVVELTTKNQKKDMAALADRTLLLPSRAGGLKNGMLSGDAEYDDVQRYDVADLWMNEKGASRRCRLWENDEKPQGMRLVREIDTRPEEEYDSKEESELAGRYWYWYVRPKSADEDGSRVALKRQELQPHLQGAEHLAVAFTTKLISEQNEARAVILAAKWHDLGKRRALWQRSIGNLDPNVVLAKSGNNMRPLEITKYRHEFGSLLDIMADPEFRELASEMKDLVLHFIASHHGRARPHFAAGEVFDPEHPEDQVVEMAREVPRRYARLQRKYGRWGLAYLESLVRAADRLASQNNDLNPKVAENSLAPAQGTA
jgi:CRISPR-associated endonuclease/helicase Cas3